MTDITISSLRESLDFIQLINIYPDYYYPWKVNNDYKIRYKSRQHCADLSVKCNWLTIEKENQLRPTDRGIELINQTDEKAAYRNQLYDLVKIYKPLWASHLSRGRVESIEFVPDSIKDIFKMVGLYDPDHLHFDDEAIKWWDKIAGSYYTQRDEYNTIIGRIGEKLTIQYEDRRTEQKPKWKSIESDLLGYDILSKVSKKDSSLLCIEVKASTYSNSFKFTKNEKKLLDQTSSKGYKIYFWRLYDKNRAELTILKKEDILNKFPKNSPVAIWELCEINLNELNDKIKTKPKIIKPSDLGLKEYDLPKYN